MTIMKTALRAALTRNVSPWVFVLACLLLALVVVKAKVMADGVLAVQGNAMMMTPSGVLQ